jgi:hypothetical protein
MSAALPREIPFEDVRVGDRVRYVGQDAIVRGIVRDGGAIRLDCGDQPSLRGMQREGLTLVERPAQAAVICDQEGCTSEAAVSFVFQAPDGTSLSSRWNRCWTHATAPLPATAPEGSIVTMTAARP